MNWSLATDCRQGVADGAALHMIVPPAACGTFSLRMVATQANGGMQENKEDIFAGNAGVFRAASSGGVLGSPGRRAATSTGERRTRVHPSIDLPRAPPIDLPCKNIATRDFS